MIWWLAALLAAVLFMRWSIAAKARVSAVDEYYWLQYRAAARSQETFPPKLPQYLLDLRQWYPPLFGFLLKLLPDRLFSHRTTLSHLLSVVRLVNCVLFAVLIGEGVSPGSLLVAVIAYTASPAIFTYDNQLNSRVLGALLFDLVAMVGFLAWVQELEAYVWLLLPLYVVALFLHKMTLQILLVLCLAWVVIFGWFQPLIALLAAIGLSLLVGYRKYLVAHIDISAFWVRNRALLGAHQIDDSPVFGVYERGVLGWPARFKPAVMILAMCPFLILPFFSGLTGYWQNLILVVVGFSLITTYVPHLRAWGNGWSYIYYVPSLVVLQLLTAQQDAAQPWLLPLLVVSWFSYRRYRAWLNDKAEVKDEAFDQVLTTLRESPLDRVQCIPVSNSDEVAWRTGKQVLWGAHGYGFRLLQPYFPVLIDPPEKSARDWNLGAVLVDKRYWPGWAEYFVDGVFALEFENDGYVLYRAIGWKPGSRRPKWADDLYPLTAVEAV